MHKSYLSWYILIVLLVGTVLVAANADTVWSTSVDLAHTYSLVFRLTDDWHLVANDPSLGEMNYYPPGSHIVGAVVGMLFGSPFLGMHLVALGSLVLLWASCLAIMYAAPNRSGPLNAIVLALLVVVNFGMFRIHGAEISGNYNYAQMVAQALVYAVIAVAIRLDRNRHRVVVYLFLLGAIQVITGFHLLPALELLGVFAGLLLLDSIFAGNGSSRIRNVIFSGITLAIGVAIVVFHPAFAAMRAISANNGAVDLGPLGSIWAIGFVCMVVLALSFLLLRAWYRDREQLVMYKYLALYGLAVAGLCMLQMVLRVFDLGSDYAVKKYAYSLVTFMFMQVAVWIGQMITVRMKNKPLFVQVRNAPAFWLLVFGIALAVVFTRATPMPKALDTSDVVNIERQLILLRDTALPAASGGKSNLVMDTQGMPMIVNYMFSLAVTRTPRPIAEHDFLGGTGLASLDQYGVIVSSRGHSSLGAVDRCAKTPAGPLVVLDAACIVKATREASVCKKEIYFSRTGWIDPARLSGFSSAESEFRWTEAAQATFSCTAGEDAFRVAKLELTPFTTAQHRRQRLRVSVNAGAAVNVEFNSATPSTIEVPLPKVAPGEPLVFKFDLPDAVSPQALGMSMDTRQLGVAVRNLRFE